MYGKWFEIGIISFASGILLDSFTAVSFTVTLLMFVLAAVSALTAALVSSEYKQKFAFIAFTLAFVCAGVARYQLSEMRGAALESYKGKRITVEGVIKSEPDVRETLTFLNVSLNTFPEQGPDTKFDIPIRVGADRYPVFSYGDRLRITGVLSEPKEFETATGAVFDYPSYLAKDGIYYEMFRPR